MNPLTFAKRLFLDGGSEKVGRQVRLIMRLQERGHRNLAALLARRLQSRFGVYVSPMARIARTVVFPHPTGVVIGEGVVIHDKVRIYQNVTLGGARVGDQQANNYPEIGAGSTLFAGAVVVGKVKVGANCVIGANSVVLQDVPDGCVAAGVPARIVRRPVEAGSLP
jgi:serine O-acetyltransferase